MCVLCAFWNCLNELYEWTLYVKYLHTDMVQRGICSFWNWMNELYEWNLYVKYLHTDMVQCACGIPGNMVPGYLRSVKGTKAVVRGCGKPGHAPESHKRGTADHAPPSCQQPDSGAWQRYRSINTFSGSQIYRTMLEGKCSWYSAQKEV